MCLRKGPKAERELMAQHDTAVRKGIGSEQSRTFLCFPHLPCDPVIEQVHKYLVVAASFTAPLAQGQPACM